ncbi:MAG: iron-containing alcohol dehydrogenase [Methanomassiliicoccales archaeon]
MWEFTSPRSIVFGEDSLERLEELEGERALIIAGSTVKKVGILDLVVSYLEEAGMEVATVDRREAEPSIGTVEEMAAFAREYRPDWIVGLGGGSSLDAAKAVWVLYERPELEVGDISPLEPLNLRKKARLMCIPTTSGSGSEANWATVISDPEGRVKMELASRELVPDLVIADPSLTASAPSSLTSLSGLDALTHAIEAYASLWRNDFSDALAVKAVKLIFQYLPRTVKDPDDMEAREGMQNAALMAGWAFGNSHCGMAHALGHAVGAVLEVVHGQAVTVFLPLVVRHTGKELAPRYGELLDELDIDFEFEEDAANVLAQAIVDLALEVGVPCTLCDLVDREEFEAQLDLMVERALMSSTNLASPGSPDSETYRALLIRGYEG